MPRATTSKPQKRIEAGVTQTFPVIQKLTTTVVHRAHQKNSVTEWRQYEIAKKHTTCVFRESWHDSEYRAAYMEAAVEQGVAWQIKVNREIRNISQRQMAELLDTHQPAISRMEDPEYGAHSLDTLKKIANVFDCALLVRFIPFSVLARESESLSVRDMYACPFSEEVRLLALEQPMREISNVK